MGTGALARFRLLYSVMTIGIVVMAALPFLLEVLADVEPTEDFTTTTARAVTAGALALTGALLLLVARRIAPRLDGTSASRLRQTYFQRMFLHLILAEVIAVLGLVAYLLTGAPWLGPLTLPFAAVQLIPAAPTERNVARDQDRLSTSGSSLHLVEVL